MKVLITGGHFSPAYSIIEELMGRGYEVAVAGRRHPFEGDHSESFEYQVCKKENLPFFEIKTGRYQRKFSAYTISSLLKTPIGFVRALQILREAKPDVVMTFGGYIGLPIAYAARVLSIPVVLHEQTQNAGLASMQIARVAKKVCISFKSSQRFFANEKSVFTGNPIRREVFEVKKNEITGGLMKDMGKVIYVTGGSTGSHFVNSVLAKTVDRLLEEFVVIHQVGDSANYDDYKLLTEVRDKMSPGLKKRYILRKFIFPEEIGSVFDAADLILSRAGANTLFEIFAKKKISLLIPLPHGQASEQLENAKLVARLGIGEVMLQSDAEPQVILSKIKEMMGNEKKYKVNMDKTEEYVIRDAAKKIVDIVESVKK